MSETIAGRIAFSLREVTLDIKQTILEHHSGWICVKAEMNKLNYYPHSGHCYPELVEKQDGKVVAQMRANLWKDDYARINRMFLETLKEPLKEGITILFRAKVTFDPVYGLALGIADIDPSFSLGELEREKRETIDKLRKEGIFDLNRTRPLPLLPQRVAVISVETSKGYADFSKVILRNPWGYRFFLMLFPALLQGDQAAAQIIGQLRRIRTVISHFDVVAIIRGGGGDVGLSCYNDYALSKEIALFPVPVMTGIGHSTNETVAEMVSFRNAITPTELADMLIQRFHDFSVPVKDAGKALAASAMHLLATRKAELNSQKSLLAASAMHLLSACKTELFTIKTRLASAAAQKLVLEQKELAHLETRVQLSDPVHVLKRGYSITLFNGKPITHQGQAGPGDEIETVLHEGRIRSIIK